MIRAIIGACMTAVVVLAAAPAAAQTKNETGQAERPADHKQVEPESQSHNAEKPKKDKKGSGKTPASSQGQAKKP